MNKQLLMKNISILFTVLSIILLSVVSSSAQSADCECEDSTIKICYLQEEDYCYPNFSGNACGYELDGVNMNDYLRRKLLNNENFGADGTVDCALELNVIEGNITLPYIQEQECDIIFLGNYGFDTLLLQSDLTKTSIPDNVMSSIRDWSMLCPNNLVIATQAEANMWGYIVENENVNPNSPAPGANMLNIFNGPFGDVPSFSQGGTYQGVITSVPSTGYTVLAVDVMGRPTAVIDSLTNDLIFGDIGIFCGGGAGSISFGDEVNNRNDRFTCNIFALGCSIAGGGLGTQNDVALCTGTKYTLPSGQTVSDAGNYIDTLIASNFCDSIVVTNLSYFDEVENTITYEGCSGDGYEIFVGGVTFNEDNLEGNETLISSVGCDSIVTVKLSFAENTSSVFQESICDNDNTEFVIGTETFDRTNLFGSVTLENAKGCDSIVDVDILLESGFVETEVYKKCSNDLLTIRDREYLESGRDTFQYTNMAGCDSIYIVNISNFADIPNQQVYSAITPYTNEIFNLVVPIEETYSILWEPAYLVGCSDCATTTLLSDGIVDTLTYTITDENLCSRTFDISLSHLCRVYLPNVLTLKNQGSVNALFGPLRNSKCDISEDYELSIYDRWGNTVFYSNDPDASWDGNYRSQPVSLGVYIYNITYKINDFRVETTGDITVM